MRTKISSFAVLDLETTSIPDLNFNKTNITEISIHGFNAEDVSTAKNSNSPRINHKLTLLFNPRMVIEQKSEEITGLNNYMLENESSFDDNAAHVIINFLKHLRQPVCLVAHNGNKFDFPILKNSFTKLKLELPNDILCLDSLVTIKDLDLAKEAENETDLDFIVPLPDSDLALEVIKFSTPSKSIKTTEVINEEITIHSSETPIKSSDTPIKSTDIAGKNESPVDWQKFNETTPRRPPNVVNIERKRKRQIEEESSATPPIEPSSRKSLKFIPMTPTKTPYKLGTIHERLFGKEPENAHHAEADVVTLKKIMLKYGKSFVDYAEKNATLFREVKRLGAR